MTHRTRTSLPRSELTHRREFLQSLGSLTLAAIVGTRLTVSSAGPVKSEPFWPIAVESTTVAWEDFADPGWSS